MKSKYIKRFRNKYLDDREEFEKDVKFIEKQIENHIMNSLYKGMSLCQFLEKIIINFDKSADHKILRNKIIGHGQRVYKNANRIMTNLEKKEKIFLTDREKGILTIACMMHDIGKVYSDKNHNFYSVVIIDYILSKDKNIPKDTLNSILEIIYFHSHKGKRKEKISILAKILRDSDLFDENCGESLFILLLTKIENNNSNLNNIDYKSAKLLLKEKTDYVYTERIKRKINITSDIKLYTKLLREATMNFYEFIQPFEYEQTDLDKPYCYNNFNIEF